MNETLGFTMSTEVDNPPDVLSTNVVSKRQGFTSLKNEVAQKKLASKNVFVRKGEDWQMPDYLRITMGFPEENKAFI